MRIDYIKINARALDLLLSVKKHASSIDPDLRALVELRISQINGCSYCIDLHCREARQAGVSQQKLDCLSVSKESGVFPVNEIAAIRWAECVTNISTQDDMEQELDKLLVHYSEKEAVDLTLIISLMNSLNRMAISFGDKPEKTTG